MIRIYTPVIISFLFVSCGVRIGYLGTSSAPTSKVDVFVDASAIKRPYTIIGKGYPEYTLHTRSSIDQTQKKAIKKARETGADAILFQDLYISQEGASIHSVARTDSVGKGLISIKNATVSPIITTRTDILFLKYN